MCASNEKLCQTFRTLEIRTEENEDEIFPHLIYIRVLEIIVEGRQHGGDRRLPRRHPAALRVVAVDPQPALALLECHAGAGVAGEAEDGAVEGGALLRHVQLRDLLRGPETAVLGR